VSAVARPRLAQWQAAHPKRIDAKLAKRWKEFGLPPFLLKSHRDCVQFLMDSDLASVIVGYRESCANRAVHDVKLDPADGHPMLKVQGRFVRWETFAKEFHYNPKTKQIKDRNGVVWDYYHPQGLVPIDRLNWQEAFPVYELTQEEYDRTLAHAHKFYETNPERDPGIPKDCIVQFATLDHWFLPKCFLFENLQRNLTGHICIRLITPDRKVYSFGTQLLPEQARIMFRKCLLMGLSTTDAKIGMRDKEEFCPDNKRVTSIPLTGERAQNILNRINELSGGQLRFQFTRQNCSHLMREVIQIAGYDVDTRTTAKEVLFDSLPSLTQIPVIKTIVAFVGKIWDHFPAFIKKPIAFTAEVLLYIPTKIITVMTNCLVWQLGGTQKMSPLRPGVKEEEFYDKKKMQNFSTIIRSWKDLFNDETSVVYHSKLFVDWQKKQRSTFYDVYNGRPKFSIVPSSS
jgi:hypothetical protein